MNFKPSNSQEKERNNLCLNEEIINRLFDVDWISV